MTSEANTQSPQAQPNIPWSQYAELGWREVTWRDHQVWLQSQGYFLRPRFRPGWVPSWASGDKDIEMCEDRLHLKFGVVIDALRLKDDKRVILKMVFQSKSPNERELTEKWSQDGLTNDPRNHCVPLFDVLQSPINPDIIFLVLPMLRPFNQPHFDTYGEAIDFFQQVFEGLHFIHEHGVVHRDCGGYNIMMDPTDMFPNGFHHEYHEYEADLITPAKPYTRTQKPPKYYFIDFGISTQYDPLDKNMLDTAVFGADITVPEHQGQLARQPSNPFLTDVYYLGNMIKRWFIAGDLQNPAIEEYMGFEFMKPLVDDMTQNDPSKRPTMGEVIARFEIIKNSLSQLQLRSRPQQRNETSPEHIRCWFHHWRWRVLFSVTLTPPIPYQKMTGQSRVT
ncbi:hypothetical protein AX16_010895 [Volvariella volvacea WC 439]|nr:hypothetical protein AX16_010895 [Volvariella volvacea WC 439]